MKPSVVNYSAVLSVLGLCDATKDKEKFRHFEYKIHQSSRADSAIRSSRAIPQSRCSQYRRAARSGKQGTSADYHRTLRMMPQNFRPRLSVASVVDIMQYVGHHRLSFQVFLMLGLPPS